MPLKTMLILWWVVNNADFVVSSYSVHVRMVETEKHQELAMVQKVERD